MCLRDMAEHIICPDKRYHLHDVDRPSVSGKRMVCFFILRFSYSRPLSDFWCFRLLGGASLHEQEEVAGCFISKTERRLYEKDCFASPRRECME